MNPLEETQEITVNDVLGFAEECLSPKVVQEEIEEFLDLVYLTVSDIPKALCQVAVEVMKDLTIIPRQTKKKTISKPIIVKLRIPLLKAAYTALSVCLRRWALAITNFDFDLKYEDGATHFLPDYLWRI